MNNKDIMTWIQQYNHRISNACDDIVVGVENIQQSKQTLKTETANELTRIITSLEQSIPHDTDSD
jgi:hypothetical protein